MESFTVKTASQNEKNDNPYFYVLNKGLNSGKPLSSLCPNCFKVEAKNEETKEALYWLSFSLWKVNAFHPFLVGSVIPFIRIRDYKQLLIEKIEIVNCNPVAFTQTVNQLRFIEQKEKQFKENLKLIQEFKNALVYNYLK
jgi:hypothetical protein